MSIISSQYGLVKLITVVIGSVISIFFASYVRKNRKVTVRNESVLLGYYTDGSNITPVDQGQIGRLYYQTFLTISKGVRPEGSNSSSIFYRIELPYATDAHLVGIPKTVGDVQINPAGKKSLLESVALEGDYDKYFNLYAEKDMGSETQYILDPKTMVFTIDFCKNYNWEIVDNQLYLLQAFGTKEVAVENTFSIVQQFLNDIQPAIKSTTKFFNSTVQVPYGQDRREDLKCPLCAELLLNKQDYFQCTDDHGVLINGAKLLKVRDKDIVITINQSHTLDHQELICPACTHSMSETGFNGTSLMIDSCSYCPYRWLDAKEVVALQAGSYLQPEE